VSNSYVDLNTPTETSKMSFVDISKTGFVDEFTNFDEQPRQQRHSQEFITTSKIVVETSTNNVDNKSVPELRKKQNDYNGFNSSTPSCITNFYTLFISLIFVCLCSGVDFTNAFHARFLHNVTRKRRSYEKRTQKMCAKMLVKSTPGVNPIKEI